MDSHTDPVGFGGQFGYYTDVETGLDLLTHRYYDPQQGRFVTRDPIGYKGGINLYGFTGNNPVNDIDPSGLDPGQPSLTVSGRIARWFRNRFFRTTLRRGTPTLANRNRDIDALTQGGEDDAGVNDVMRQTVNRVPQAGQAAAIEVDNAIGAVGEAALGNLPSKSGLNKASSGLKELFAGGSIRGKSIIGIRGTLLRNGFTQSKARGMGYLFRSKAGEQVRVMSRNGGWDVRVRNRGGGYLDEFGNQVNTGRAESHGINVSSY